MTAIAGVYREPEFSPGRVADDAAILDRTAAALGARGFRVRLGDVHGVDLAGAAAVLAMCQSPGALAMLDRTAATTPVINAPQAIRGCYRHAMVPRLATAGVPTPPTRVLPTDAPPPDAAPCWVKRGDVHAMAPQDVVFAPDHAALAAAVTGLRARGVTQVALQEHVEGTVVKFYGVAGGRFFRCYTDAATAPADLDALWRVAAAATAALGLEVFGGDLVVPPGGEPVVVDVNDWPSFARCRDEAAEAIADYVVDRLTLAARAPARHA